MASAAAGGRTGGRTGDAAGGPAGGPPVGYRERLWVPWPWWVLGLFSGAMLSLEVMATLALGRLWIGWMVLTPVTVVGVIVAWLVTQSLTRVEVVDGELVAGPARLPASCIGDLRLVDTAARRRLMGPEANPAAYTFVRPWVRTAVLVEVTDPADPTPYWLVSTRHPFRLAAALGR